MKIELTKGATAIVDDADFEILSKFNWCLWGKYAARCVRVGGKRKRLTMHHAIMNPPKGMWTDHANRNKLDNRRCNLRCCTPSQNQANRKCTSKLSGFQGVTPDRGRWKAHIEIAGEHVNLGRYDTATEAAKIRDGAALHFFKEFAVLNFPDSVAGLPLPIDRIAAMKEKLSCQTCGKLFTRTGMGQHRKACGR